MAVRNLKNTMYNPSIAIIIPSEFESKYVTAPHHVSGMGKIKATQSVYDLVAKGCDLILLAGFCGGLKGVEVGEVCEPWYFVEGDYDTSPLEVWPNYCILTEPTDYYCISQDRFIKNNPYKFDFKKCITDMESYAVTSTCSKLKIPVKVVRIVSDIVGENSEKDFLDSCKNLAGKLNEAIEELIR